MPTKMKTEPKVLIPEIKLQARIKELAQEINQDYQGREVVAICILKGSFMFYSDLIREIELPMSCEFLGLSSYGGQTITSGEVKVTLDINEPLNGKHVIVFEDIVDSGYTLRYVMSMLRTRGPASIKVCSLLYKPDSLKAEVQLDYVGFKMGNEFVVGYGLDYNEKYRTLPFIGYIENEH